MAWFSRTPARHRIPGKGGRLARVALVTLPLAGLIGLAGPGAQAAGCTSSCTVWDPTTQPTGQMLFTDLPVELGMQFNSTVSGTATGVRFYKNANETGTNVGHLWDDSGNMLAQVTFTTETASGWQQANLSSPVTITAGTNYWVSYEANNAYVATLNWQFPSNNPPLQGTKSAYMYGGGFPTTASTANYWVDVVFQPPPPPSADLAITMKAPSLLLLGDKLAYQISVTNNGPGAANAATVTDVLPGNAKFVSATTSQGSCSQASGTVKCSLGTMAPGGKASLTITVDPTILGTVKNTATVSETGTTDPKPANNSASASTLVVLSLLGPAA